MSCVPCVSCRVRVRACVVCVCRVSCSRRVACVIRLTFLLAHGAGTGKTLAYLLPLVQLLHADEKAGMQTEVRRPPCLILLPNRELSKQVLVCALFLHLFLSRISSAFCIPYLGLTHSSHVRRCAFSRW